MNRLGLGLVTLLTLAGCHSPEAGRARGGGRGADAGNYLGKPIHVPSKLDATKDLAHFRPRVGPPGTPASRAD